MKMLLAAILLLSSGAAAAADLNLSRGPGAPGAHRENRRLSGDLQALRREYGQHRQARTQTPFRSRLHVEATETVAITVAYESSGETAKRDLRRLGARRVRQYGRLISAELPVAALAELERLESIRLARPSYRPILRQGRTTSQAVTAFRADEVRSEFAVDGTGISIGTLSDSFDCFGDAAADVASDDLPADIVVLAEPDPCDTSDEGRAMMQLIHDVAPGAHQLFHSEVTDDLPRRPENRFVGIGAGVSRGRKVTDSASGHRIHRLGDDTVLEHRLAEKQHVVDDHVRAGVSERFDSKSELRLTGDEGAVE
ncbi:MAG: hypothetical protein AAFX94_13960 [Myxococcota bacterium]